MPPFMYETKKGIPDAWFGDRDTCYPKSVIVYSNILYTFAFVNDIKKWNKAVRSFVVKTVSNV